MAEEEEGKKKKRLSSFSSFFKSLECIVTYPPFWSCHTAPPNSAHIVCWPTARQPLLKRTQSKEEEEEKISVGLFNPSSLFKIKPIKCVISRRPVEDEKGEKVLHNPQSLNVVEKEERKNKCQWSWLKYNRKLRLPSRLKATNSQIDRLFFSCWLLSSFLRTRNF